MTRVAELKRAWKKRGATFLESNEALEGWERALSQRNEALDMLHRLLEDENVYAMRAEAQAWLREQEAKDGRMQSA